MAVDPATLPGYLPPPPTRPPRRTLSRAILIALGGATFFFAFFAIAAADPSLARAYHTAVALSIAFFALERLYSGFQEDGPLGAIHRLRNPFGNLILGDDIEHTNCYSIAILFALAVGSILSGVLALL
ncbi:MAG: hypothetical protein IT436_16605 [Phycisphaerales bacterium]|nr:hypothetical protein [Phycisphaerales bacterium]